MVKPEVIRRRVERMGEDLTILTRFQRYDLEFPIRPGALRQRRTIFAAYD